MASTQPLDTLADVERHRDAAEPMRYVIVLSGELAPGTVASLGPASVLAHEGLTTVELDIVDAAHLNGVMEQIERLGLTVDSVSRRRSAGAANHRPG